MAQDIKIGIGIVSNTKEETNDVIKLKQAYNEAGKAANRMGGTAGSRAVAAKAAPGLSGQEYGRAQGATGGGSSARDFAKEAQGLGGLVRVYATFAANLFAVSAAFTALRDAASTTNIVKGLDQLGAASGRNLGTLATQLSAASDGAISLRDSMTAVAQASSGGLANKQILQLGDVAKKASEALGLSMPDALSRLSRGITKIEPELLDELGIFVKVDEASQKYALSIGKSAASLSDFEKRQAFANAVLEQGIRKFGDIKIEANPYDKLLASMNNVATTGLQLVNTVLGPIASILAESPVALAGVFGLIAATLLRQAIPALSQWRGELTKSAETAAASAKKSYEAFSEYSTVKAVAAELKKVGPLQQEFNNKIASAQTTLAKTLSSKSKILAQAMTGTADPEVMQKALATEQKRRETTLANLEATKKAEITAGTATADRIASYDKLAKKQEQDIINIKAASAAYIDAAKTQKDITNVQIKTDTPGFEEKIRKIIAERAQSIAVSKGILARVGSDTEMKGVGGAFNNLFDNIRKGIPVFDEFGKVVKDQDGKVTRSTEGLKGLRAATTAASGSFLIVGDAIGKGLSALSPYLQLFAVAVTAYQIFSSYASSAAKEQEEFNSKLSEGEAAIKTIGNTFDTYVSKKKDAFSLQGISAFTTALAALTDSLNSQLLAYDKFKQVAGTFDNLKDSLAGFFFFTESNLEKLQKSTIASVQGVVKSLELSGKSASAKGIIAQALFGKDASIDKLYGGTKELIKAFDGLTEAQQEEKIKKIALAIDAVTKSEQYSTNAAIAFDESLKSIDKTVDQIVQANAFTDLQGKLGVELVLAAERFGQALMDPVKALSAIAAIGKDPKALAALGNVEVDQLKQAIILEKQLSEAQNARATALDEQTKAKAGTGPLAQGVIGQLPTIFSKYNPLNKGLINEAKQIDIAGADKKLIEANIKFENLKKQAADFSLSQIGLVTKLADAGFEKIEIGLKKAKELAQLSIAKTASGISASGGANVADRNYAIRISELKIQETLINANYAVQIASIENSQKLDELNTTLQLATAAEMKKSSEPEQKAAGEALFKAASQRMLVFAASAAMKTGGAQDALSMRSITPEILGAARARNNETVLARKQAEAASAGIRGQMTEAGLTRDAEKRNEALRSTKEGLDLENQRLNTQNEALTLASKILGYDTAGLIIQKQSVQQQLVSNDTAGKLAEIEKDRLNSLVGAGKEDIKQINLRAQNRVQQVKDSAEAKKYTDTIVRLQELGAATQGDITRESAKTLENLRLTNSIEEAKLTNLQAELGFKQQLGLIDERSANAQKAAYDLQALTLKSTEEEARIQADIALKQAALDTAKGVTRATREGPTEAGMAAAAAEANAQSALTAANAQLTALKTRTTLQQTAIDQAKTYNDELIKQKQTLADMNANTQALSNVFGEIGQKIGEAAAAMAVFAKNSADRLAEEANAKPEFLDALKKKNAKDRLSEIAALASAQKKQFKEETVAYKAINALEKSASLERLALAAKEAGLSEQGIQDAMANASKWIEKVKDGTFIQGIQDVINQGAGDPYTAIPRMIAMASFVSSLTGKSVSGPPPIDQGTLAGTGQQVGADGQTIGTRAGGVLGDPKATAKSITDSIDGLSKVFFNNLGSTSSNLISSLKGIQENTYNTAKALGAAGVLGSGNPFSAATGESKAFSTGIGLLDSALGSIFGGSTSRSVTGAGIMGSGTAAQFAGGQKEFTGYTNVRTETSGGWFSSGSTRDDTLLSPLDKSIQKGIKGIFNNFNAVLLETADSLGQTKENIQNILNTEVLSLKVSNVGLTGTEFAEKLSAEVSIQLNAIAEKAYPFLSLYTKVGEESFQVAARLIKDSETVTFGLSMVNNALSDLGSVSEYTVAVQQQVIKNFGGTAEDFASAIEAYYNALFSDSEKAAFGTQNVQKQLSKLGQTGITTNKQLKDLIASIDPTTELYANLVKLAPAFVDANAAAKKLTDSVLDQESAILTLVGKPEIALANTRAKELDAIEELLKPRQIYINALTDEVAARDKLKAAYNSSNTALTNSIKTLNDYKTALTTSANSTLTPSEKYAQAKSIFMQTAAAAQAVITASSSATDIANRDAALAKIQSTGDALLGASKEVNASGAQYASDFASVSDTVGKTADVLSAQQSDQQKQLGFLEITATATDTMATLLQKYLDAQATTALAQAEAITAGSTAATIAIPGHARGGLAEGISLVGEQGPEIVDFVNPGRVYSNQASNDLFNTKELIAEIKALREEVIQLRDDQNKQTGAIIDTTIQSNVQNAQMIATANANMVNQQDWKTRSQVRVA